MRKKTIKYTIVDLGGTRYVVLRLADIDCLIQTHHHMATELVPQLSDEQWTQYRSSLYVPQQIHVDRISHCKVAILSKTDYDSLNLAIAHLRALWITLCVTIGPSEAEQPSSTSSNNH